MTDNAMSWGLDNPDCNYSFARVRGDARYRIDGHARQRPPHRVPGQHRPPRRRPDAGASAAAPKAWRTVSFLSGDDLRTDADGRFEIALSREPQRRQLAAPRRRRQLRAGASVLRRLGARAAGGLRDRARGRELPAARAVTPSASRAHFETLSTWLDAGARCWDASAGCCCRWRPTRCWSSTSRTRSTARACTASPTGWVRSPARRTRRCWSSSRRRAAACGASRSPTSGGSRSSSARARSSLNGASAELDPDGVFRGVIAHGDPGVPNWLDPEGCERGTLAVRFLFADATPKPVRARGEARFARGAAPPAHAPRRAGRAQPRLARRHAALQRRYGY